MDLKDALGDWPGGNQNPSGGQPQWPGQQNPAWPSQPSNPMWPGQPGQPSQPSAPGGFPGAPSGFPGAPTNPSWNSGPSQPGFPGAPSQPSNPTFPGFPGGGQQPSGPGFPSAAQTNMVVPFKKDFHGPLQDKMLITIRGRVKPHAVGFKIDLCTQSDLAFHFNPRFNENGKQLIVCNTLSAGKWGKEERTTTVFPFRQGQEFELKILVTPTEFKVAVNNSHLLGYRHREDIRRICSISIHGDITLTYYNVERIG